MGLRLEHAWVWDSWIADDGDRYHLFFLKADRDGDGPASRHTRAVVGHATSTDLTTWSEEPDALVPAPGGWDDVAHWTGSIVRADDGRWWMYYTALGSRGHGVKDQRIGIARSDDLEIWTRLGDRPAVEADGRWYKTLDEDPTASETWRDPFVQRVDGRWHMYVTARVVGAPRNADGVLAHAVSRDLEHWTVLPPASGPAGFGQIEVPQVRCVDGQWVLVFTCHPQEQSPEQVERYGEHSTWSVLGEGPLGPWDLGAALPFEEERALFAAPLVQQRDGSWAFIGFLNLEPEGIDAFEIVDPIPVEVRDGRIAARR